MPDAASQDLTPATLYALVLGEDFCAAASGGDPLGPPARGLLALPESEYTIEQADIDGVNLKLLAASAASSVPTEVSPDGETPEHSAPPSLRTAGLAVVRGGRAQALQDDFRRAAAQQDVLASDTSLVLTAEDLVRGHRIDVFDEGRQRWFSLHQRVVSYNPPGSDADAPEPVATATDEGFFQVSLVLPEGPCSASTSTSMWCAGTAGRCRRPAPAWCSSTRDRRRKAPRVKGPGHGASPTGPPPRSRWRSRPRHDRGRCHGCASAARTA